MSGLYLIPPSAQPHTTLMADAGGISHTVERRLCRAAWASTMPVVLEMEVGNLCGEYDSIVVGALALIQT